VGSENTAIGTLSRLVGDANGGATRCYRLSTSDVWISDGLARYSEELYAEQKFRGKEAGACGRWTKFAVGRADVRELSAGGAVGAAGPVFERVIRSVVI